MKALEYSGLGAKALVPIIHISNMFDHDDFDTLVSPVIVKLFSSTDRAIRVALCENLGVLSKNLGEKTINDKIFPNMVRLSQTVKLF